MLVRYKTGECEEYFGRKRLRKLIRKTEFDYISNSAIYFCSPGTRDLFYYLTIGLILLGLAINFGYFMTELPLDLEWGIVLL